MTQVLTTQHVARLLGRKPQTLRKWRMRGHGPRWRRHGFRVYYPVRELNEWLAELQASGVDLEDYVTPRSRKARR